MEKNLQSESRSIHYNWMWFQTCHDRLINIPANQSAAERFSQQKRCCKQSKGIFLSIRSLSLFPHTFIYLKYSFEQLLFELGFIQQASPGMFTFLPLGLRVLNKLQKIIDNELHQIGCQKVTLPTLTSGELWKKTGILYYQLILPSIM